MGNPRFVDCTLMPRDSHHAVPKRIQNVRGEAERNIRGNVSHAERCRGSLFTRKSAEYEMYEEGLDLQHAWYNRSDRQRPLLAEWQSMSVSHAMHEKSGDIRIGVFRDLLSKLMALQYQLHDDYHTDPKLRDHPLNASDIQSIQDCLHDCTTRTGRQRISRVANRLSTSKKSTGNAVANIAEGKYTCIDKYEESDTSP